MPGAVPGLVGTLLGIVQLPQLTRAMAMLSKANHKELRSKALILPRTLCDPAQIAIKYRRGDTKIWLTMRVCPTSDKLVVLQSLSLPLTMFTQELIDIL